MISESGPQGGEPSDFGAFREMIRGRWGEGGGVMGSWCFRVEGGLHALFLSERNGENPQFGICSWLASRRS